MPAGVLAPMTVLTAARQGITRIIAQKRGRMLFVREAKVEARASGIDSSCFWLLNLVSSIAIFGHDISVFCTYPRCDRLAVS